MLLINDCSIAIRKFPYCANPAPARSKRSICGKESLTFFCTGINLPEILLGRSEGIRIQIIHGNEPGMVSAISAAIGARKININNMVNKSRKDVAVTVLEVEKAPDARLLTELMALPNVIRVRTW